MRSLILVLFALGASSDLYAGFVQNGDFESVPVGIAAIYGTGNTAALPGWMITGSICGTECVAVLTDTYAEGPLAFPPQSGTAALDLTATGNTLDGGVQQTVTTLTPGQRYTLSFWQGSLNSGYGHFINSSSLLVSVDGVSRGTFTGDGAISNQVNWQQMSLDFTATSESAVIRFENATEASGFYVGLDNVSLELSNDIIAPEPSTFALLAFGGLVLARRKYRNA